jgi:hypothetical protein
MYCYYQPGISCVNVCLSICLFISGISPISPITGLVRETDATNGSVERILCLGWNHTDISGRAEGDEREDNDLVAAAAT